MPTDFPDADLFARRLAAVYGDTEAGRIIEHLGVAAKPAAFWVNPLVAAAPLPPGRPLAALSGVFLSDDRDAVTRSAAAASGAIYVQSPSSILAVRLVDAQPGEEILDLAAAPGGKALGLAVSMHNTGRLAVVEVAPRRFHRLEANLRRCGVTNAAFYLRDGAGVGRAVPERFDRVLLDAPCSSEARFDWGVPASYAHWRARKVKEMQRKQKALLRSAYLALRPGGTLLYCTCSFGPEENELVVDHLLARTDAELLPVDLPDIAVRPGLTAWAGRALHRQLALSQRIVPDGPWTGFYLARVYKPERPA